MKAIIIESSNWLFMMIGGYGVYTVVRWKSIIPKEHRKAVIAWAWCFLAITINVGFFALARHMSGQDNEHNLTMLQWRWVVVPVTALMFSWGMLEFIQFIEGFSIIRKLVLFLSLVCVALFLGYI